MNLPSLLTSDNELVYYTWPTPNGLKPAIVLEELELKYRTVTVDIYKNQQKENWFLEINPNGRVPAFKQGDMRIFESGAIMLYLVDRYDDGHSISYPRDTPGYYEVLSWLMFQMGGLGPMQGQYCRHDIFSLGKQKRLIWISGQAHHFRSMAGARSPYGIQRYANETKRLYSVLESRLSQADWLAGDKYTIADIACYSWVRESPIILEFDLDGWPGVARWLERIAARPAVQRGLAVPFVRPTTGEKVKYSNMRANVDSMANSDATI